ncbi:MAG TPA: hypothetical protein VFG83_02075 [Kofleriaceae bacterium]|nr:hypothetical protein [Kofleriaceae bacterium]
MKILSSLALGLGLVALPLLGCGGGDDGDTTDGPVQTQTAEQILATNCSGGDCHTNDGSPEEGLDLVSPGVASRVVGRPANGCTGKITVVAGDPSASYILEKLSGTQPTDCGVQMPDGKAPLSAAQIDVISTWIAGLQDTGGGVDAMPQGGADGMTVGGPGGGGTGGGGGGGGGGGW